MQIPFLGIYHQREKYRVHLKIRWRTTYLFLKLSLFYLMKLKEEIQIGENSRQHKNFSIFCTLLSALKFPRFQDKKRHELKKKHFVIVYPIFIIYIPFARTAKKCYLIMSRSERYIACNYYASGAAYFFCVKWFDIWCDGEKDLLPWKYQILTYLVFLIQIYFKKWQFFHH